jgi:4-amino-4-deoxychorismate lyase
VIYVDGQPADSLPIDDRGLNYGDGLFETVALRQGEPQHWDLHYARLVDGAARLGIDCPASALLRQDVAAALPSPAPSRLVAKIILTRGSGGRGYAPPVPSHPRRIVRLSAWPEWPQSHVGEGIPLSLCATPLGRNPVLAGLKHLNRLEQVLASRELAAVGAVEGLMFDDLARLIEGTRTNVFLVAGRELLTPRLDQCGIAGVMRTIIMDLARLLSLHVTETRVERSLLYSANELFVCNSLIGIWPAREILSPIGRSFSAMPVTRRLMLELAARDLAP